MKNLNLQVTTFCEFSVILWHWYWIISGRPMLSNINMSTIKSETCTPVTDVTYFKPNEKRDEIVTSLEVWAARLLKPDITDILKVAKRDSNTKIRFQHAKNPTNFQLTGTNYTTTGNDICDKKPTYNCRLPAIVTKLAMSCS
jgi:hypothetical protein